MTPADKVAIIGGCYLAVIAGIRWLDTRIGRHRRQPPPETLRDIEDREMRWTYGGKS